MSSKSEPAFIGEIEKLANAATQGPWNMYGGGGYVSVGVTQPCEIFEKMQGSSYGPGWNQNSNNLRFAAASRQAVPELIAHIRSQAAEIEKLKEEVVDYLQATFVEIASLDADGWYCTNARSTAVWCGGRLVELGIYEASEKNEPSSRVHWYRPIKSNSTEGEAQK